MRVKGAYFRYISPNKTIPPHPVPLMECRYLINSLKAVGWDKRPLLAYKYKSGGIKCITGSHRIKAARKIGMKKIPVLILRKQTLDFFREHSHKSGFPGLDYTYFYSEVFSFNRSRKRYKRLTELLQQDWH